MVVNVWCGWASALMSGVKIRRDNAENILDAISRLSKTDVLVGIPAGPQRDDAPLTNAEIGYLQSTGATVKIGTQVVTLPPRPFLDIGIEDSQDTTTAYLKAAAEFTIEGKADKALRELEKAGQVARDAAKRVISDGDRLQPLSEKTLEHRRTKGIEGEKPLYVTHKLMDSITYIVRSK
ncbi:Uncharacterised protein [Yersinia enterocolitica]|nr:Uncharacterised protein [Yersinia enterocolitica]